MLPALRLCRRARVERFDLDTVLDMDFDLDLADEAAPALEHIGAKCLLETSVVVVVGDSARYEIPWRWTAAPSRSI